MESTVNYGLKKPEKTDYFDIEDFNGNSDKVDGVLGELHSKQTTLEGVVESNNSLLDSKKLDKTGVAADSAKFDGKSSASYAKRYTFTIQGSATKRSVIAFCKLDGGVHDCSYSIGKLTIKRSNGTFGAINVDISCEKRYNTTSMFYNLTGATPNVMSIKACTFMYNGVKYGGFQIFEHGFNIFSFEGETNFNIFGVDFLDLTSGTEVVMNSEINNSIEFTSPDSYYNFNIASSSVIPIKENLFNLGSSTYKWNDIYAKNTVIQTSDKRQKTDIQTLENEKSLEFLKELNPIQFRFNEGVRTHYGFNAQEVEEVVNKLGIDFAGFIKSPVTEKVYDEETGEELEEKIIDYDYGLRYSEFIPLLLKVCQMQQERIEKLEELFN